LYIACWDREKHAVSTRTNSKFTQSAEEREHPKAHREQKKKTGKEKNAKKESEIARGGDHATAHSAF
jgi:hypothetical protein